LPQDENEGDYPIAQDTEAQERRMADEVTRWLTNNADQPYLYRNPHGSDDDFIEGNRRLGRLRRYILVIKDNQPPVNAYVAHFDRGTWYYIDGNDTTSQKNFALVSLFVTMMAAPPTTPPLSPSISVGGS
jgi:hypothetical protein